MKLIHLSDLHLGKKVNEFSMIEDQKYILTKIINVIDEEKPDGILIAGDIYDRSIPPEEAVQLWDDFLNRIVKRHIPVFAISGNHDSAIRFADHDQLIDLAGVYFSPGYTGMVKMVSLEDENGPVNIYLLPFVKPMHVRAAFPEEEINDYTDACRVAVEHMNVKEEERNILVAHQFVTGAERCESEETTVGGLDNVDASVFDCFDYVALGHIHGKQKIGREMVRYCGTPLKYSFSEKDHVKSVTVVEMGAKGSVEIREVPLVPRHDLREIRGTYDQLTSKANYEGTATDDYIQAILTDEEEMPGVMSKLRSVYPNIMKYKYDNLRTKTNQEITQAEELEKKTPLEILEEFYQLQNNQPMTETQRTLSQDLFDSI